MPGLARHPRCRPPLWHPGLKGLFLLVGVLLFIPCARAAQPIRYLVDLSTPETHIVQVTMTVTGAGAGTEIQFPTWNALYQIRDFVKNVVNLQGECDGQPAELDRPDLNTWRGPGRPCASLIFHYGVRANTDGPFDSVLDNHHSFLNLAMILFYLPRARDRAVQVNYQLPAGWKLATFLEGEDVEFQAPNYDTLVDSPVEAGHYEEFSFPLDFTAAGRPAAEDKHATVRVIIDAERGEYSSARILGSLQKITAEEVSLMQDLPFTRYTFLLHFPREGGSSGGMEHLNGTAITISAAALRSDEGNLESVAAHEFFHAWNVKRIRPQLLEPIDYLHGNDTRDLWFCEGVTSTYAQLALLRAGIIDHETFYARMADAIETLESRPARGFQSVETSGREAWLEKYSGYTRPERSISYYNKGELLGYLLDLGMRHASQNRAGLDDVMRRLNQDFARHGRYYTLEDIRAMVARLAPGCDAARFLADNVRGVRALDYSTYLAYAGLTLATQRTELAAPGFTASRNSHGLLQVESVEEGSSAAGAGLLPGDILMMADGERLAAGPDLTLPSWRPGQAVQLQVVREGVHQTLNFQVGAQAQIEMQIQEDPAATREQRQVREGWLRGVTAPSPGAP